MAALAGRTVAPIPPRPVRRARLRAVGLGHRTVLVRRLGGRPGSRRRSRRAGPVPAAGHLTGRTCRYRVRGAPPRTRHSPGAARRVRPRPAQERPHSRRPRARRGPCRDRPPGLGASGSDLRQVFVARFLPEATQEQWRSFDELQRRSTSPENAWRFVSEFGNIEVTDLAPKVTVPTLIMCSRREPGNRFEQSRLLAALIPKSRLVPLDSSNHLLPERDPAWKQFLAEIDRFLLGGHP